jgi:hypothetical protein
VDAGPEFASSGTRFTSLAVLVEKTKEPPLLGRSALGRGETALGIALDGFEICKLQVVGIVTNETYLVGLNCDTSMFARTAIAILVLIVRGSKLWSLETR